MNEFIIISSSARALAESASRAGHDIYVIDCFTDNDTKSVSKITHQIKYNEDGFIESELLSKVQEILAMSTTAKIVLGSGFESNPGLVDRLKALAPTYSNTKDTISALKNPLTLSKLLERNGITHPHTQINKPEILKGYLVKKIAGHGGTHINWLEKSNNDIGAEYYYQEFISGDVFSVLFLANGNEAKLIGFNQQLKSEDYVDRPFLYKGAIKLNKILIYNIEVIESIINKITIEADLRGLCGLDYVINEAGEVVVIEVNPRPPATFELHEGKISLFNAHLAALSGDLLEIDEQDERSTSLYGYAIVYAKENLVIREKIEWPEWVKDKPQDNSKIKAKFPVCTVHAKENSLDKVKAMLFNRLLEIETRIAITDKTN